MLSFRVCNNFLFYQHARMKLKAYLAYLHIHITLLLCGFCNVTLGRHTVRKHKSKLALKLFRASNFFQLPFFIDGFWSQEYKMTIHTNQALSLNSRIQHFDWKILFFESLVFIMYNYSLLLGQFYVDRQAISSLILITLCNYIMT